MKLKLNRVTNLNDLKEAITTKLQTSKSITLEYFDAAHDLYLLLDNFEDLEEGMRIKVSTTSRPPSITSTHSSQDFDEEQELISKKSKRKSKFEQVELQNWYGIVIYSQLSSSAFRIEIDPDEIPKEIEPQVVKMMEKFSKLKICSGHQTASNVIFQLDLKFRAKAEKIYDEIVQLYQSVQPKN